jgi:hypothetical protein
MYDDLDPGLAPMPKVQWNIGREGRAWTAADGRAREPFGEEMRSGEVEQRSVEVEEPSDGVEEQSDGVDDRSDNIARLRRWLLSGPPLAPPRSEPLAVSR